MILDLKTDTVVLLLVCQFVLSGPFETGINYTSMIYQIVAQTYDRMVTLGNSNNPKREVVKPYPGFQWRALLRPKIFTSKCLWINTVHSSIRTLIYGFISLLFLLWWYFLLHVLLT